MENARNSIRRFAVVTGASSGIGYELAREFAKNGFDLLIAAEDRGIVEAAQAFQGMGVEVRSPQVDLATYEGVESLYAEIKAMGRPLEAIAINAGVGVGGEFARQTSLEEELNVIRLNVISSVHLTKRVLQDMVPAPYECMTFWESSCHKRRQRKCIEACQSQALGRDN